MLSKILLSLIFLLASATAQAQLVPAENIEQAKAQAEQKCKEGCIVLSPQELDTIQKNIAIALRQAYEAGLKGWGKQS